MATLGHLASRRAVLTAAAALVAFVVVWNIKRGVPGPPSPSRSANAPQDSQDSAVPPTLSLVHYIGRFDRRDANATGGARFSWPGSAIIATFEGTGIVAKIKDEGTNYFAVTIDRGPPTTLATVGSKEDYVLAEGLPQGRHTLELTKRTEAMVGAVQLLRLSPVGGALVPTPDPFRRRIELVGDSITCGYGNLGANAGCSFTPATEDETVAYGGLTGRALGAEVRAIAYSGIGMVRSFDGNTADQMPVLFERTLAKEPAAWTFDTPEPDVVVINLGTNDFSRGDPGAPFARAYAAFLEQLRGHYPHAHVICALSPMILDAPGHMHRTAVRAVLQKLVADRTAAGDARISTFEFDLPRPNEGFGCDFHPSAATHRTMATALVDEIRARTGW
ncbi:MAG TPA: SGNH/GDSL hydrolase family protein [Polyangiaceae bacterium]|jgi:lysophospholipase L1-like esterase|nr:SGNH/GDSL hydrolase family protein [Polyangiaceae bacterium]